jgi:hypothetical protein
MLMQSRDRRSVVDPPPGVPYMISNRLARWSSYTTSVDLTHTGRNIRSDERVQP